MITIPIGFVALLVGGAMVWGLASSARGRWVGVGLIAIGLVGLGAALSWGHP